MLDRPSTKLSNFEMTFHFILSWMSCVQLSFIPVAFSAGLLKDAMPPKPWYGLSVGRRQSYHLPFSMQTEETWCLRGVAEVVEEVEVDDLGDDMLIWGVLCI